MNGELGPVICFPGRRVVDPTARLDQPPPEGVRQGQAQLPRPQSVLSSKSISLAIPINERVNGGVE